MRRSLLLLWLALPALSSAQTAGSITFVPDDSVGVAECDPANGETINLRWTVSATGVAGGTYRVYAASRAPSSDSNGLKLCDTNDVPADGVYAAEVASVSATGSSQSDDILASDFVNAAGFTCDETSARTIYVCVHFIPSSGTEPSASATGQLTLDLRAPAKPTIVSVLPGETALRVDWDEGTGGADTTYYRIQATTTDPLDPKGTHESGKITGTIGRIEGLVNGVEYQVTVTAYSEADNASAPSDPMAGTPVPVADFWESYEGAGGREQGGCSSGPAGALGILGALLALALPRRRK